MSAPQRKQMIEPELPEPGISRLWQLSGLSRHDGGFDFGVLLLPLHG